MELRDYQNDMVAALFAYWQAGGGNPLVEAPTGTGKSLAIADLTRRFALKNRRVLILSHVREIIEQDATALLALWPDMPIDMFGINSAALNRRDTETQILLATVQSVFRNPRDVGWRSLLIVDEAQRIPKASTGMYHKVINGLREIHPGMRVAGFTATPYRLDCGRLDQGNDRLFDELIYAYSVRQAIEDGWLAPLIAKGGVKDSKIDTTGVGKRGGEFITGQLERAADKEHLIQRAVDEIIRFGADRGSWLVFCCGVDHALHVGDELRRRGVVVATVTGETPAVERKRILNAFKAGQIRALTGCDVFTTGFDAPKVDLVALLRPTMSPGLYVQMCGRGTRRADGKTNCMLLDFGGNVMRHGPIDDVSVDIGKGRKLQKECPSCQGIIPIAAKICPDCGHEFPTGASKPRLVVHNKTADEISPLGPVTTFKVQRIEVAEHHKPGRPPSLRVDFITPTTKISDWLALAHTNGARWYARKKWLALGGCDPVPTSAREALERRYELGPIAEIKAHREGNYWRIIKYQIAG